MNDVVALEGVSLSRDMNLFYVSITEDQTDDLVVAQLAHQEIGTTVDEHVLDDCTKLDFIHVIRVDGSG